MAVRNPLVIVAGAVRELPAEDTLNALGTKTVIVDEHYNSVSLLLHGDGVNGATTIIDDGPTPKSPVASAGATIQTGQSKFGGSSMYFNGTSGHLVTVPSHASLNLNGVDWTIEAWAYPTSVAGYRTLLTRRQWGNNAPCSYSITINSSTGKWSFYNGVVYDSTVTAVANQWVHIAVTRSVTNNYLYFFIDGVLSGSFLGIDASTSSDAQPLYVGAFFSSVAEYFAGYTDDLRITKGVARYTSNFTPPTEAFGNAYSATIPVNLTDLFSATRGRQYVNARAFGLQ